MSLRVAASELSRRPHSMGDLLLYLTRAAHYMWISVLNRPTDIRFTFGSSTFLMRINPLGAREGSRGIFVFRECYEPLLTFGSRFVKAGNVAFDLGANQGIFCCAFGAAVGRDGRVIAVEPIPRQVDRLRANIQLNGFTQCNVMQKAISDHSGSATLGIAHGDTSASILAEDKSISIEVETISVDEIVRLLDLQQVDFIKLDVEGAELLALQGARNTLVQFQPTLSIEASDPDSFQQIREYLEENGYQLFVFDSEGELTSLQTILAFENNVIALARPDLIRLAARSAKPTN